MIHDKFVEPRRFWAKVKRDGSGCWFWTGGTRDNGYGSFSIRTVTGRWTKITSSRYSYQNQVKAIPDGYEVDHLCRVRHCVRPDHLEAVTLQKNRERRDNKTVFVVPVDDKPLPTFPPPPLPEPKPTTRDPMRFCRNGHAYAVAGKVSNGPGLMTCAVCRKIQYAKRRNGNAAAGRTHCPQGHPYSGDNLDQRIKYKNGRPYNARECRTCQRAHNNRARLNH